MLRKTVAVCFALAVCAPDAMAQDQAQAYLDDLTRRLEAMERIMSTVISREEENTRRLESLTAENQRLAGDLQMRVAQLEEDQRGARFQAAAPPPSAAALPPVTAPVAASMTPGMSQADSLFSTGKAAAERGEWDRAAFDLEAFVELETAGDRWLEAQYLLGQGLMAEGKGPEAASRFLTVYQAGDAFALAWANLFALAQVLQGMDTVDSEQKCALNAELMGKHIAKLSTAQLDTVRATMLAMQC